MNFYTYFSRLKQYGEQTAFVNKCQEVTYREFTDDIEKLYTNFLSSGKYYLLNIQDKYLFTVSYLSVILSGNIACLQPYQKSCIVPFSNFQFETVLNDEIVQEKLQTTIETKPIVFNVNEKMSTVICSSGTTAKPKAVALSSDNILSNLVAGMKRYYYKPEDCFVNILPYSHCFGLMSDLLAPLYAGSKIVFTYDLFEFFNALPVYNPTALNLPPGIIDLLLKRLETTFKINGAEHRYNSILKNSQNILGNSLKKIMSGGANTPELLVNRFKKYGIDIYSSYGLTECSCGVTLNGEQSRKEGSCGKPLLCNKVEIDNNRVIHVSGKNVMMGYLDDFGKLQPLEKPEWVTQDIGYFDQDGYLYVIGRIDDLMIFQDGTKIMPQEIEKRVNMIEEVNESVAYKKNGAIHITIVVSARHSLEKVKNNIFKMDIQGHRITNISISTTPLQRNLSGKIIRTMYL